MKFPVDSAYEALKAAIDELRHQVGRLKEMLARHEDHFAAMYQQVLDEARQPNPVTFSDN